MNLDATFRTDRNIGQEAQICTQHNRLRTGPGFDGAVDEEDKTTARSAVNQSINQSINQWDNQSISRTINQSVNQR
jgi:hypothetical protein